MPNTRTNDPETSHEAAETVTNVTETHAAIMTILGRLQVTDDELFRLHFAGAAKGQWPYASESGVRSRRAELVRMGKVQEVSRAKTRFGRNAIVWASK